MLLETVKLEETQSSAERCKMGIEVAILKLGPCYLMYRLGMWCRLPK